ncbi:MAG: redoxin domain-containing protein [Planctomycetota bacterium]
MSRRSCFALLLAAVAAVAYFVAPALVRRHVDGLIQHAVGRPWPAFTLVDRAGRTWTDADLRGRRAVLHFFRSRCHSCDGEAAAIRDLEGNLPADVVLLHVVTDALQGYPPAESATTIASKAFAGPVAMADAKFADSFHKSSWSQVTPITYVADAAGVVRYGLRGAQSRAAIEQALAAVR